MKTAGWGGHFSLAKWVKWMLALTEYRPLLERGGKLLIEQGMEAWAAYVRTQRAFLVTWATQEALAQCRALGIEEPDLTGEVHKLVKIPPLGT